MNRSFGNCGRIARLLASVGVAVTLGGIAASPVAATPVGYTYFNQTLTDGTWLTDDVQTDYTGVALDTTNLTTGSDGTSVVGGTTISGRSVSDAAADIASGTVNSASTTSIISQVGPDLAPGALKVLTTSSAAIADSFTITAIDAAALIPGAVATLTFTIDGDFKLPTGLDLAAGETEFGFFEANTFLEASGTLGIYEQGAIDLDYQITNIRPEDYSTPSEYINAYQALIDELQTKIVSENVAVAHTSQQYLDQFSGIPSITGVLKGNGPVEMIISVEVPLSDLSTTFEWLSRLSTRAAIDASEGSTFLKSDFVNTGVLTLTVPDGFKVTSASGLFPDANITVLGAPGTPAVPEPVTAALGVMSIAGLMFAARRRRVA